MIVDFALFQEALDTAQLVEKIIKEDSKTKPLLPLQLIRHREIQLPDGKCEAKSVQQNALSCFKMCTILCFLS